MWRKKLVSCPALTVTALVATVWLTAGQALLWAASDPQTDAPDSPRATIEQGGEDLLHYTRIRYPREAAANKVEGSVSLEVAIDEKGHVYDARVLSGPEELRAAALQSVLGWHYSDAVQRLSRRLVSIRFELPEPTSLSHPPPGYVKPADRQMGTVKSIEVRGLPDPRRDALLAGLPVQTGDPLYRNQIADIGRYVRDFDEHLRIQFHPPPSKEGDRPTSLRIFLPSDEIAPGAPQVPKRIRVGGPVQAARLEYSEPPAYPPLAKQAGVEGTVNLTAVIGRTGEVQSLEVKEGHPLLVPAALQAVKHWRYQVTRLNGEPVEVVTQIDVKFELP